MDDAHHSNPRIWDAFIAVVVFAAGSGKFNADGKRRLPFHNAIVDLKFPSLKYLLRHTS